MARGRISEGELCANVSSWTVLATWDNRARLTVESERGMRRTLVSWIRIRGMPQLARPTFVSCSAIESKVVSQSVIAVKSLGVTGDLS